MGSLSTGGGSSAVAASAHAGCERHRLTDTMVTGMSRRRLAEHLGNPDISAGIPEARWMRAMTFERLVQDRRFVSELLTKAVGALGLTRPSSVYRSDARVSVSRTQRALEDAHKRAVNNDEATIVNGLALPFVGMENDHATAVKPDFAIVAPREAEEHPDEVLGSWLIMGDAKDYERVRSRIDDQRMLKGFLQVALGAESAAAWSVRPTGMRVHRSGVLAVPRNAFLQPEAVVECLDDHRREVRIRADERTALLTERGDEPIAEGDLEGFVEHLEATFDPRSCATCSLFNHCRTETRSSTTPEALLIELGIRPEQRPALIEAARGGEPPDGVAASLVAGLRATRAGLPEWSGQLRVDPVGEPGTVDVVLAKADAAALGIHGVGVRWVQADRSRTPWVFEVFQDPQAPATRLAVMEALGTAIGKAMAVRAAANRDEPGPVHVVAPDNVTGDVLVSIADSLAGVEISRLRWEQDRNMGRPALTFDGEPARIPKKLSSKARLALSFLLEADRARAMILRDPLVDLRSVLARHVVPGGPGVDAGRLDYLVAWAEASTPLDHRVLSDEVTASTHTPGARLANTQSDAIHEASRGRARKRGGRTEPKPERYEALVLEELKYKADVLDRAGAVLDGITGSRMREIYEALECDAQVVWRRRLRLHASDLVRFGLTREYWRNKHVDMLDKDEACAKKLLALGNPHAALDMARDAGRRPLAMATVTSIDPLRIITGSRQIADGPGVVAVLINGEPCAEAATTTLKIQKGSFKFGELSLGPLEADRQTERDGSLLWASAIHPQVSIGDDLVVADLAWFTTFKAGDQIAVGRPAVDEVSAPAGDCDEHSFEVDPEGHYYCCRPHEIAEAETADWLADRRERGELNPETWPPVVDEDQFDVPAKGSRTAADEADQVDDRPGGHLTIDDLD